MKNKCCNVTCHWRQLCLLVPFLLKWEAGQGVKGPFKYNWDGRSLK